VPTDGSEAPASAARAYVDHVGQSQVSDAMAPESPMPQRVVATGSTRDWPSRSSSRPCTTAKSAFAIRATAETEPAKP
jgi:hypothetical protein